MAATKNLIAFGTDTQLAATLGSLATGTAWESASTLNTTTLAFDYLVQLTFTVSSGSPATAGPYVNIYAAAAGPNTLWPIIQLSSGATKTLGGNNASVGALSAPNQLVNLGTFSILTTTSSAERTFRTEPMSVAQGFGGSMPDAFSIIVENQLGVSFSSSTATTANYLAFTPIWTTSGN